MLTDVQSKTPTPSRRDFLARVLAAWSFLTAVPFVAGVLRFISPVPSRESGARESLTLAAINDLPPDSSKIFRFNKEPVILVHTQSGQFKAFSARCTHLGCIVQYMSDGHAPHFSCNCHGSEFDMNGKNITGPASYPLVPFRVSLQDSSVVVSKIHG